MKLSDLGRLVAQHLAQGKADWEVNIFQWEHQSQPVTDFLERPGILEFYSDTDGKPQECRLCDGSKLFHGDADLGPRPNCLAPEDDIDDLI